MARVTVEDCIQLVNNRFELVLMAAHRARGLSSGAPMLVERDRDKNPVVALREIAEEKLNLVDLKDSLIKSLQKYVEPDNPDEEVNEIMQDEQAWVRAAQAEMAADDDEPDVAEEEIIADDAAVDGEGAI